MLVQLHSAHVTHDIEVKYCSDDRNPLAALMMGVSNRLHCRLARSSFAVVGLLFLCLTAVDAVALERCPGIAVDVTTKSAEERRLACSAAADAIELLGRCSISLQRPLQIVIQREVRHPFNGAIFGLFDTKRNSALITQAANIASMVKGTPYAALPEADFYKSLIVHEVVHGIMYQNLVRPVTTHAAYEYSAYALQIESMPQKVREQFLRSFDRADFEADFLFNDIVLFFNPYFFAARAYMHFNAAADRCVHLNGLLRDEARFIALPAM